MEIMALICPRCDGQIHATSNNEIGVCSFCRTEYMIDGPKPIPRPNPSPDPKERLIENAETFFALEEIEKAREVYTQVTNEYPADYRGWLGLMRVDFHHKQKVEMNENDYAYIGKVSVRNMRNAIKTANSKLSNDIVSYHIQKYQEHAMWLISNVQHNLDLESEDIIRNKELGESNHSDLLAWVKSDKKSYLKVYLIAFVIALILAFIPPYGFLFSILVLAVSILIFVSKHKSNKNHIQTSSANLNSANAKWNSLLEINALKQNNLNKLRQTIEDKYNQLLNS